MMIAWKKFCRTLSSFVTARAGNVAITFAFASLPIIAFVGAAVDYSRANSVKAAMQTALDSTALMLSKEAATDTEDVLKANALKYFTALLNKSEAKDIAIHVAYGTSGGSNIAISADATLPAEFKKFIGLTDDFALKATSTVRWGVTRLRVALVLDNTGSMNDNGKIGALKTATQGLLSQLQGAVTTPGDIYVSIIPFVKDVNLGAPGAGWVEPDYIYWGTAAQDPGLTDNSSWDAQNGTCSNTSYNSDRNNCVTHGVCSGGTHSTLNGCTSHGVCTVGGTNSNDVSQTTCATRGACSITAYNNNQSGCTSHSQCSNTNYTTQSNCTGAGTCSNNNYTSQSTCTSGGTCDIANKTTQSTCTNAHHCVGASGGTQTQCQNNHGTWAAGVWTPGNYTWTSAGYTWDAGVWTPSTFTAYTFTPWVWTHADHTTWNGCVMDRGTPTGPDLTYNYDTNAVLPDPTKPNSLWPAEQYGACPQGVKGLSYDWSAMNTLVNNMVANGNTNQAIGLQVGWQSLVGGGPFTIPALDSAYQYTQVIILLTDGLNTQDRWYSCPSNGPCPTIDGRQQLTCDNIKQSGVVLYTIQVNTGTDPTSSLLQGCASDQNKFYLLTSADEMTVTFQTIGTELTKLRVAQ